MRFTPEHVAHLQSNEVYVFGANKKGVHGRGSALHARSFGAKIGVGKGHVGQTYGIPTRDCHPIPGSKKLHFTNLSLQEIKIYVDEFIEYAARNSQLTFLVVKIGTNNAGYQTKDIAPLFIEAMRYQNIILPEEFYRECEELWWWTEWFSQNS